MSDPSMWWKGSVTYQIYPRSFQDSNGDGIGDLNGITRRLPHVAELGVDAIWLSPFFTSPMMDMGYDVANYTDVDPLFGTLEDFKTLLRTAHDLGLKVIIDQVLSHSSDQHPFFRESRLSRENSKADWYVWADPNEDGTPPNNWQSVFGGPGWQWEPRRQQYYLHNFLKEQPDFNFHNPDVQEWLLNSMRFWLDLGVDGFRLDVVNYYFHDAALRSDPPDHRKKDQREWQPYSMQYHIHSKNQPENLLFLEKMRSLLDEYDNRALVGEVGDAHHAIEMMGQYTSGRRLHMAYSFEMLGPNYTAGHFRQQLEEFFEKSPQGWPCWAFSNHDTPRHVSRWQENAVSQEALAKQACALLLSLQGSVCIYQGEELGQTETELEYHELTDPQGLTFWPENKGRDGCRTPMTWERQSTNGGFSETAPWLPVKAPQLANSVDGQQQDTESVLAFYRQMLRFRQEQASLRTAETTFLEVSPPLLAFTRGKDLTCVFNLSTNYCEIPLNGGSIEVAYAATLDQGMLKLSGNGFALISSQLT